MEQLHHKPPYGDPWILTLHASLFISRNITVVDHMSLFIFRNITVMDLAIPDTYCSPVEGTGYQCPPGMICMNLGLKKSQMGFNGFDDFGKYKNVLLHEIIVA